MGIRDVFIVVAKENISAFYLITHTQQSAGLFVTSGFIFNHSGDENEIFQ